MRIELFSRGVGIALAAGVLVTTLSVGSGAQLPVRPRLLPGVGYTIRVSSTPGSGSGMAGALADPAKSYRATAVFAGGRGRLDITDGGVDPLFAKGDYVLFDSTGMVIVKPAAREFVAVTPDAGPNLEQLESMGLTIKLMDLKVTIDSLPAVDTVAGYRTRHFHLVMAYNMSVEAAGMLQRLATEVITDYWMAAVPGLPGNPFLRANGFSGGAAPTGVFKGLSTRIDSAAAIMGSRVALRTVTASRLVQGPGSVVAMRQTSDVDSVRVREVDERSLILPAGYTMGTMPGAALPLPVGGIDAGAKWRVLPRVPEAHRRIREINHALDSAAPLRIR